MMQLTRVTDYHKTIVKADRQYIQMDSMGVIKRNLSPQQLRR